jgi:polyisoprenoid-binding protein YceI
MFKNFALGIATSVVLFSCKNNAEATATEATGLNGSHAVTGEAKWDGQGVGHGHVGTIAINAGEVTFTNGVISGGTATVDMKSMKCTDEKDSAKNAQLMGHLMSKDFFNVDSFGTASIKIDSVSNGIAHAALTIKNVTNAISFPVTVTEDSTGFTITSSFEVDRTAFGITYNSTKFFDAKKLANYAVSDNFKMEINLKGTK